MPENCTPSPNQNVVPSNGKDILAVNNEFEYDLRDGPVSIDLQQAVDLDKAGNSGLVAIMDLGGSALSIYGTANPNGTFKPGSLLITKSESRPGKSESGQDSNSVAKSIPNNSIHLKTGSKEMLGRNTASAGLGLNNEFVSRQHASIELTDDGLLIITDLDSSNGTLLIVGQETQLQSADQTLNPVEVYEAKAPIAERVNPLSEAGLGGLAIGQVIEKPAMTRREQLFAVIPQSEAYKSDMNYDLLFADDASLSAEIDRVSKVDKAAKAKHENGRSITTDESLADAEVQLDESVRLDPELREVMTKILPGILTKPLGEIVSSLQNDSKLRLAVGSYYLDKVGRMAIVMPERVMRNQGKRPNYPGYTGRYNSHETVAMYCLAMLDGTFMRTEADKITYDPMSDGGVGQHRYAARIVLGA